MGKDEEKEAEEVEQVEDHDLVLIRMEDGSRLKNSVGYIEY